MSTKTVQHNDCPETSVRIRAKALVEEGAALVENAETLEELYFELDGLRRSVYQARLMVGAEMDVREELLWRSRKM